MDKSNEVKKFTAQGSRSLKPRRCCEWYLPRLAPTVIMQLGEERRGKVGPRNIAARQKWRGIIYMEKVTRIPITLILEEDTSENIRIWMIGLESENKLEEISIIQ